MTKQPNPKGLFYSIIHVLENLLESLPYTNLLIYRDNQNL